MGQAAVALGGGAGMAVVTGDAAKAGMEAVDGLGKVEARGPRAAGSESGAAVTGGAEHRGAGREACSLVGVVFRQDVGKGAGDIPLSPSYNFV